MIGKNVSSKAYSIIRAGIMACLVPAIFIYIFLSKPDYKLMIAMRGVVVPVAHAIGDFVTWPVRATGGLLTDINELASISEENKELRAKLDDAMRNQNTCAYLMSENERLEKILQISKQIPQKTTLANVIHDLSALHHSNFIIDKGKNFGVSVGNVVTSTNGEMVGIVVEVYDNYSRVRALSDSKSNIPVRAAGTDVYGFLHGNGNNGAVFEFLSDPEFEPTSGVKLVTSGIKGNLPNDIGVGEISHVSKTKIASIKLGAKASHRSEVMVLSFDSFGKYK